MYNREPWDHFSSVWGVSEHVQHVVPPEERHAATISESDKFSECFKSETEELNIIASAPRFRRTEGISFTQTRLWFAGQYMGDPVQYNIGMLHKIHGPFSAKRLEKTLFETFALHEIMRTAFLQDKSTGELQLELLSDARPGFQRIHDQSAQQSLGDTKRTWHIYGNWTRAKRFG
ncbi:hypothetical protein EYZ11_005567 [Aspergillus tanneri]|uniref:Condensation domain-containing protein n=1 Tax=Aspergillus tanneri TaxID=1220188 RepID=A0A4S3JHW3_9EURO|nr:hypothetical protein EYZ11_005567 [Aspergillus tanneri]